MQASRELGRLGNSASAQYRVTGPSVSVPEERLAVANERTVIHSEVISYESNEAI